MPTWLITLLELMPQIIAEIAALIAAIQSAGGTPTPAQIAKLQSLGAVHSSIAHAVTVHLNSL
jgi:hypothetical protein